MNYLELLRNSAEESGSIVCMGLDPVVEFLPVKSGNAGADITKFFRAVFRAMKERGVSPGAFKPNIGYYAKLDRPLAGDFSGSSALSEVLKMIREHFPSIPVILDSKRGDIASSSANYADEAFESWETDALTVSPYMGSDSVGPFISRGKGVYILDRTSNPGAADFQDFSVTKEGSETLPLYSAVALQIIDWAQANPGTGAVVGATSPDELEVIAGHFAEFDIPMLIPGVGSQGGSGRETVKRLLAAGYDPRLARINSSSGITHPWKKNPVPENWVEVVVDNLAALNNETAGRA